MVRERAAATDRRLPLRRDRPAGDADFDVRSDCGGAAGRVAGSLGNRRIAGVGLERRAPATRPAAIPDAGPVADIARRSEEHTSELQSLMHISYAVFCLKNKIKIYTRTHTTIT